MSLQSSFKYCMYGISDISKFCKKNQHNTFWKFREHLKMAQNLIAVFQGVTHLCLR
jgi:hypothetical protein